ncbi:hypothetical protein H4Q26_013116 [Puccinia striiformis f. sp. tritici PST-130]|nr:hypothetical protein H4Q26_013116 [Puccinia striiformis f. sp. tritici PST-130]
MVLDTFHNARDVFTDSFGEKSQELRESTGDIQFYAPHEKADCTVKALLRRTVFRPFEMVLTEASLSTLILASTRS